MPHPDNPEAVAWGRATWERIRGVDSDFVIVGHSLGGSTVLKVLAEQGVPRNLLGVITMATPFWGASGWEQPAYAMPEDVSQLRDLPLILYFSADDEVVDIENLELYAGLLPWAEVRRLSGIGHLFDTAPFDTIAADIASLFAAGR
jgi:predicted alpha/beta hydrolase family esterase